jgi:PAS domain S-box-containing protein
MAPSQTPTHPLPRSLGDDAHSVVAGGLGDHLLERMTDAFLALDREWRVVYMNSAAKGLNARPRPDVIGRVHWEEWPQTVGSEVERQYRLAMTTQRAVHFEHHYVEEGQDFWHSIHAYPDANGLSIFYRDITEQKRSEELAKVLATAGSRFAATLDRSSTLAIVAEMALPLLGDWAWAYLVDERGQVTESATAAVSDGDRTELARITAASLWPGNARFDALHPRSLLSVPLIARGRTIGGITFGVGSRRRAYDEHDEVTAREIALPAALALDNALLFDAERAARRDAEDANQSKAQFLRAMSHEFRTPLNAIGGYTQLLLLGLRGELTPTQRSDVERIERNLLHVTSLINDIISFTRLEAGRVEFENTAFTVKGLLDELESFVAPQVGKRPLVIRGVSPTVRVFADRPKTTQILVNLLTNALKHTPPTAAVEITCEAIAGSPVRIAVRDEGPGIPPEQQQKIFEPFVQLGRELKRPVEGLGLGHAIARDLARGMSGDLTLVSAPGQGCLFTLSLPVGA